MQSQKKTLALQGSFFKPLFDDRLFLWYNGSKSNTIKRIEYTNKMKSKRILQVNKLYYPYVGGIERVVCQVAEGLAGQTEMSVLVCSEDRHYKEEMINSVHIVRVPSLAKWGNLPIPFGLTAALRKLSRKQDIIHLHMPFPFGDLACLLSGFHGKIVLWWHSDVVRQKKMMFFYKPIMMRMLKRADAIVVATEGHIKGSAYLKPFMEKCVVIPFGVDKEIEEQADAYIAEKASKRGAAEGKLKAEGSVRFLFVGRLVYYKGCDVLIKAFAKTKDTELVVVGSGNLEGECRKLVKELGIEKRVTFLGEVSEEELYLQFAMCDVFVLPSVARSEAFGLVQIEAMAFGKPVINTALPSGVPYVSLDKITGLTVPPGDVSALADAMQWMAEHEEEREKMGEQARKRMKEEYRMETMLARVAELYRAL